MALHGRASGGPRPGGSGDRQEKELVCGWSARLGAVPGGREFGGSPLSVDTVSHRPHSNQYVTSITTMSKIMVPGRYKSETVKKKKKVRKMFSSF